MRLSSRSAFALLATASLGLLAAGLLVGELAKLQPCHLCNLQRLIYLVLAFFALCGVLASVGGVLYVSRVWFVTPIAGNGYEMKVIAACVLGGISLSGGIGSVIGAGVGAAIMASISRVLVFVGLSSDYDDTITGILLIIIVVSDALIRRRAVEKARRERLSAKTQHAAIDGKGAAEHA